MTKDEVIASLAGDLRATEATLDQAIAQAATLVQTMVGSRALLNASPVAGAEAQAKAMEVIAVLGAARQAMVACHHELAKDHRRMGYGVYADGIGDKPSTEKVPTTGERLLRAV